MTPVAGIVGIGSAVPERVVPNAHFVERLDTSDEWIVRRTGVRERRWLNDDEPLWALAVEACRGALADAELEAADVDRIVVATVSADNVTPGVSADVAARLGLEDVCSTDVGAACAGFVTGIDLAAGLIESGRAKTVLVCGAEALSRITDMSDRGTAILFGDGAGAAVVRAIERGFGCSGFVFGTDGAQIPLLYADRRERLLRMEGREVYRHAVRRMVEATATALERAGLTAADLDLFVAHQANARIVEAAAAELGVPAERAIQTVQHYANTSAASIPLALAHAEREGKLRPGARVGIAAFGAGFVWGAGIIGWKEHALVGA